MKKYYKLVWLVIFTSIIDNTYCQIYTALNGKFTYNSYQYEGVNYTVCDFSRSGTMVKAKYFAQDAYKQYEKWKNGKNILFVCTGAFSDTCDDDHPKAKPQGLCIDNGIGINYSIDINMDGLAIVYNEGAEIGGIAVVDLGNNEIEVLEGGIVKKFNLRTNGDLYDFIEWGERNNVSVFQTQLLYTQSSGFRTGEDNYGDIRERRMLAICKDVQGVVHHIVIDIQKGGYLNKTAKQVIGLLNDLNYEIVVGLLNLDTGCKDIMNLYTKDGELIFQDQKPVSEATNLLVYYYDL